MTLTTETIKLWRSNAEITLGETPEDDPEHNAAEAILALTAELLVHREAQTETGKLGEIRVGRLPTMNQENYPGLGDWWVQLRIGANHDEILARVYGATPEEAVARARLLAAPPAPARAQAVAWEMRYWNSGYNMWHDWERITAEQHAEMSVQYETDNDYEFRVLYDAPPAPVVPEEMEVPDQVISMPIIENAEEISFAEGWNACRAAMLAQPVSSGYTLPEGFKLVPVEPTEEMLRAAYRESGVYSAKAYRAMLASAPEGGN